MVAGLAQKLLSSYLPSTVDSLPVTPSHDSDKLQAELTERTAEISRMRDRMSLQQNELEQVRSKLKSHEGMKDSLDAASHELVCKESCCLKINNLFANPHSNKCPSKLPNLSIQQLNETS